MFCETRFEFIILLQSNKFETRLTKHVFLNHAKIINDVSNTNELYIYNYKTVYYFLKCRICVSFLFLYHNLYSVSVRSH